ncbi:MAG: 3-methylcrotonyl-CoA carboxylase, partial [Burkholderiaceae bacterium]|nr:3-methylcrotonyl-CoA carboxylase [Burkholderiaceae bacterium]
QAQLDTGLIERERARLFMTEAAVPDDVLALACARLVVDETAAETGDPWSLARGWRLNTTYTRDIVFKSERGVHDVDLEYTRDGYVFHHGALRAPLAIVGALGTRLEVRFADRAFAADVVRDGDDLHVFANGRHRVVTLVDVIAHAGDSELENGGLAAPMPGRVIAIHVAAGSRVTKGAPLLVMEAMKMEHTIIAPADGIVDEFFYGVGEQVAEGAALVAFTRS